MPGVAAAITKFAVLVKTGAGISGFLARAAFSIGLSVVSSALFGPKVPKGVGLRGRDITTRSALEYRKVVYGQAMVSGPVVWQNVEGTNNEYLWTVIPLCWGESEDIVSVYFDDSPIPKADIDWTAGTGGSDGTGTGDVSTSRWVGANSTEAAAIRYYLGEDAQPVCAALDTAFTNINTNFRLRGVTHMVLRFLYDADTEEVWKNGIPQNMRALVKGRKIYDPRLDSTNGGSGSHRYTDSTTWEWSENPALCVADYLLTYMDVAGTAIDWTSVADAADDCEVSVDIPTSSTEDRFTCNGALSMGETHQKNLEALLSSMDGRLTYKNGKWSVRASVWEASSVSITGSDIVGDISVRGSAPRSDRFNTVRGFFIDPARQYEAVEFPHVTASEFTTRDNGVTLEYDLELPFTNTETLAQRIAFRLLEQGDNQVIADLTVNKKGANIAAGDVVDVTLDELGWDGKDFRVINWQRNPEGTFSVTLREDFSASYTDPVEGDYGTASSSSITVPSDVVPAPSSLAATAIQSGIRLSWTNPPGRTFDWIDIYASADSAWSNASLIGSTRANTFDHIIEAGTVRYYWIRARNFLDTESARNPDSDTSTVTTTADTVAIESPVTSDITDGSDTFPAETQPHIEGEGLLETLDYTAPANINVRVLCQWSIRLQISVATSGVAVGEAFGRARVINDFGGADDIDLAKPVSIESARESSDLWKTISGSFVTQVAAGETVRLQVESYRTFSTSGASPAQTHYWENGSLSITPLRDTT